MVFFLMHCTPLINIFSVALIKVESAAASTATAAIIFFAFSSFSKLNKVSEGLVACGK